MQDSSRSLMNANDYVESVIEILEHASWLDIFCMNKVFPYILYPPDEAAFLALRAYEAGLRATLMGAGELVASYYRAFHRTYDRGATFRYVLGLTSIQYYHSIMHGAFRRDAGRQLQAVRERLDSVDAHICISQLTPPFCMLLTEAKCLFAVIDHRKPGLITADPHVIEVYEKWFQNEYSRGVPISQVWHLIESVTTFPKIDSLQTEWIAIDWHEKGILPPIQPTLLTESDLIPPLAKEHFDVFLAHNGADKQQVEIISRALRSRGLNPWFDKEQVPPGQYFQDRIQQALRYVSAVAILVGPRGLGRWQVVELRSSIGQCVDREIPVIPVLLPGVEELPNELVFLKDFNWVKVVGRADESEALDALEWAITGRHPQRLSVNS